MSFPKAKLTRFNDVNNLTPSPAAYNPAEVKSRGTGGVISGKERFGEDKPDNVSTQSANSSCFRTPTPLKKRKPHVLKPFKNDNAEALVEKTVECSNKDAYIQELTDQIDELKEQVNNVRTGREDLEFELDRIKKELYDIEDRHTFGVHIVTVCYNAEKKELDDEINKLNEEFLKMKAQYISWHEWCQKESAAQNYDTAKFEIATAEYLADLDKKQKEIDNKQIEIDAARAELAEVECRRNIGMGNVFNLRIYSLVLLRKKMRRKIGEIRGKYLVDISKDTTTNKNSKDLVHLEADDIRLNGQTKPIQNCEQTEQISAEIPTKDKHTIIEASDVLDKSNPDKIEKTTRIKHEKIKKPNLNMYTESYDPTNDMIKAGSGDGVRSIITSLKQEGQINPNLKMKFYPIQNIEDLQDSEESSNSDVEAPREITSQNETQNPKRNDIDTDNHIEFEQLKEMSDCSTDSSSDADCIEDKKPKRRLLLEEMVDQIQQIEDALRKSNAENENLQTVRKDEEKQQLITAHQTEIASINKKRSFHLEQIKEENEEMIAMAEMQGAEKLKDTVATYTVQSEMTAEQAKAILKECKEIGEYTIRESEIEKEAIENQVEIFNEELAELNWNENWQKYQKLKRKYDRTVDKFKGLEEDLLRDIMSLDDEKKKYANDNFTYHVTVHRMHETIDALTKNLFESDNDVEQLKTELKQCDTSKLQLEEKKCKLSEELDNLTKLNEDLDIQHESSIKVFENEVKHYKENLLFSVGSYKDSISKIIKENESKLEMSEYDLQDVEHCLYDQEMLNSEAYNLIHLANVEIQDLEKNNRHLQDQICSIKIELERAKSEIDHLTASKKEIEEKLRYEELQNAHLQKQLETAKMKESEMQVLHKQITQLQEKSESYYQYCEYYRNKANEYEKEIDEMNNINKSYIDQTKKYEDLLQKCDEMENKNAELQKLVEDNEVLISPFRRQLEVYEYERQTLLTEKYNAENEARAMELRYAEMFGHQNHKQKIKYIVDLKEKNLNLFKINQTMDAKVRAQLKTIDKLKAELTLRSKMPKKALEANKENTPHESYASPLRDRNQL